MRLFNRAVLIAIVALLIPPPPVVEERTAKVMWAAVYNFGPRWGADVTRRALREVTVSPTAEEQQQFMRDLDAWVVRADPSREEIAKAIDLGRVPR